MNEDVRLIPCLLLKGRGLVKTRRFKDPLYLGDPFNIVRVFNEKEVDELCLLDVEATRSGRPPNFDLLREIADECFMPMAYGGGIASYDDCARLFALGFEKVVINTRAVLDPSLPERVASAFGSQAVVASIDVRRGDDGPRVWIEGGRRPTGLDPVELARRLADGGAGEILLTSIDREGTGAGYDLELIRSVASAVDVPVIAHGGAGSLADLAAGVREGGASAVAAGSLCVLYGRHRAVLINPPSQAAFQATLDAAESSTISSSNSSPASR